MLFLRRTHTPNIVNQAPLVEFDVEPLQNAIKKPDGLPLAKPVADCFPRAVAFGQTAPSRSRAKNSEDAVQDGSVATMGTTHRLVREKIRDQLPLIVGQFVAAHGFLSSSEGCPTVTIYNTMDFSDRT